MAGCSVKQLLLILYYTTMCACKANLRTKVKSGVLAGHVISVLQRPIREYWGVPYAEPPTGKLRFKKPQPLNSLPSDYNPNNAKPAACFQTSYSNRKSDIFEGLKMWYPNTNMSEDCLFLNVWSPANAENLAVLVWIYGGSFAAGSSALDLYDGKYLSSEGNVIVVTINYRLGPLGFTYLGLPETPGNLGLYDQQLALKWINENIKFLGGDPQKVTLFGSSAGAASVSYHLLSPSSWPYFNNVMIQGGSALALWASHTPHEAVKRSQNIARHAGCGGKTNKEIYDCLMNVNPQKISNMQWHVVENYNSIPIGPYPDGEILPDAPLNLVREGKFKNTSLIAGFNKDEGMMLLQNERAQNKDEVGEKEFLVYVKEILFPLSGAVINTTIAEYSEIFFRGKKSRIDILDDMLGDLAIKCPVINFVSYYSSAGNDVYVYSYEHISSGNPWPRWMGALHGYEIDHFFGLPFNEALGYNSSERLLSRKMMSGLTNLANTGDPNKSQKSNVDRAQEWPKYTEDENFVIFSTSKAPKSQLPHRRCSFWRGVSSLIETHNQLCNGQGVHSPSLVILISFYLSFFISWR